MNDLAKRKQEKLRRQTRWITHELVLLLDEIVRTARLIEDWRDEVGVQAGRTRAQQRLLRVLVNARSAMSIAGVGRAMGITRQTARVLVYGAARAGLVEVQVHPDDRRIHLVELRPATKRQLEALRNVERQQVLILLDGLKDSDRNRVSRVLDVLRQRVRSRIGPSSMDSWHAQPRLGYSDGR